MEGWKRYFKKIFYKKKVFSEREKITRNKIRSLTTLLSNIPLCTHFNTYTTQLKLCVRVVYFLSTKQITGCIGLFFL